MRDAADAQVQTVQGGIDPGETAREAAIREMGEEIGLAPDEFEIIDEAPGTFCYDWPAEYKASFAPGKHLEFDGQEQTYFLAQVQPDIQFDLDTHAREFSRVWWGTPQELVDQSWSVKRPIFAAVLKGFGLLTDEETS